MMPYTYPSDHRLRAKRPPLVLTEYCDSCGFNYPVTLMATLDSDPMCGELWCGYCIEDEGWAFDWPGESEAKT